MSEEEGYGLVMPFVSVTSKGGPHDDASFTAGWEMGLLDARLQYERPPILGQVIQEDNAAQADLVAMKHGYQAEVTPADDGWSWLKATRRDA